MNIIYMVLYDMSFNFIKAYAIYTYANKVRYDMYLSGLIQLSMELLVWIIQHFYSDCLFCMLW